jgi:ubiquitin-like-conjugating enzyme ATG10
MMVLYEFHIVYQTIYQTPVLYFQVTSLDGLPIPFSTSSQNNHGLLLPGTNQKRLLISMEMHPVIGLPFYFLHPCETSNAMELLLSSSSSSMDAMETSTVAEITPTARNKSNSMITHKYPSYLLSWLSLVAPLTGISPIDYCDL